jgi:hypothetical protein
LEEFFFTLRASFETPFFNGIFIFRRASLATLFF